MSIFSFFPFCSTLSTFLNIFFFILFFSFILKDRVFTCDNCGYVEHRDINASKNILDRGLKSFGLGTSLLDYKQEALRVS
ncbi:zinc ribbon domain-containing protein [Campylobacter coli]|uniref:zinc ribbon domain-containing protein n=1 Tax=Campylobacter coli TaxID=195 RepID=UPI003670BA77